MVKRTHQNFFGEHIFPIFFSDFVQVVFGCFFVSGLELLAGCVRRSAKKCKKVQESAGKRREVRKSARKLLAFLEVF